MAMRILIVTLLYAPDDGPSAPLFQMLCEELVRKGHQVTIIAAVPHYPSGQVPEHFRRHWLQTSEENGVRVIRVRVPSLDRNRLLYRAIQFGVFQLGAALASLRQAYDVALVTNPAIEVFLPFFTSVVLRRKPSVFFVADVYPDVGIQLNIFRSRPVIKLVEALERFCLRHATYTWIFSQSFRIPIARLGVPPERQRLIYSWINPQAIAPLPRNTAFSREFGLDDRFVVLYAGNLGLSQGLDRVLDVAQRLMGHPQFCFVFVGDGSGKEALVRQAEARQLTNVRFIPFQPFSRVAEVLATADVALLSLQSSIASSSIPSKTFSYLASGRPIIGILDPQSDAADLIRRSGGGMVIAPDQIDALEDVLLEWYRSPELYSEMGAKGRDYVLQYHTSPYAAEQVEALLQDAIKADG